MSLISSSQIEKGHEQDWIGELIITLKPEYSLSGRQWYLKSTCFCLKKRQTYKDHPVLLLNHWIKTRNLILNEDLIQTDLKWIHKIAQIVRVWLIKLILALKAYFPELNLLWTVPPAVLQYTLFSSRERSWEPDWFICLGLRLMYVMNVFNRTRRPKKNY